jgi:hypothetical protein
VTKIKVFVVPSVTPRPVSVSITEYSTGVAGAETSSLKGVIIQVWSSENKEKDLSAKVGQARSKLYFVGADWDTANGTI